jgi:hypothetical protein
VAAARFSPGAKCFFTPLVYMRASTLAPFTMLYAGGIAQGVSTFDIWICQELRLRNCSSFCSRALSFCRKIPCALLQSCVFFLSKSLVGADVCF